MNMFSVKNEYFSLCFSLPVTLKRRKCCPKWSLESGDLSGDFKNIASENARVNSKTNT